MNIGDKFRGSIKRDVLLAVLFATNPDFMESTIRYLNRMSRQGNPSIERLAIVSEGTPASTNYELTSKGLVPEAAKGEPYQEFDFRNYSLPSRNFEPLFSLGHNEKYVPRLHEGETVPKVTKLTEDYASSNNYTVNEFGEIVWGNKSEGDKE